MSLELLGFRILAPHFGNSIYVWGSLIGLVLAALAGGYYFGGWLADNKRADIGLILKLYGTAALFLLFDLFSYQAILKCLGEKSIILGSFLAAAAIFLTPMVVLAAVSPIVIKILSEQEKTGRSAGLVYAWGTIGSILGTFLTAFILIPFLGSRLTFYICFFLALVIIAIIFILRDWKKSFFAVLVLLISLFSLVSEKLPANVILQTESAYNQIRLVDKGKFIALTLNSQQSELSQSGYVKEGTLIDLSLIDLFNVGLLVAPVKDLLVLGMSGGASVRQFQEFFPSVNIDAVEIDPKIIAIARDRFGVEEGKNLKIFEADARPFLAASDKKYDMIEIDLFQGSPYIPFYVLTQEFFQSAASRLNEKGLIMMNIYAPGKKDILAPILATMGSVFASVFTIPINDNQVVLATRSETNLGQIKEQIQKYQTGVSPKLKLATDYALTFLEEYKSNKKTPIFTDDWAPVELLTYRMLKGLKL